MSCVFVVVVVVCVRVPAKQSQVSFRSNRIASISNISITNLCCCFAESWRSNALYLLLRRTVVFGWCFRWCNSIHTCALSLRLCSVEVGEQWICWISVASPTRGAKKTNHVLMNAMWDSMTIVLFFTQHCDKLNKLMNAVHPR